MEERKKIFVIQGKTMDFRDRDLLCNKSVFLAVWLWNSTEAL